MECPERKDVGFPKQSLENDGYNRGFSYKPAKKRVLMKTESYYQY
jgi:hypothetical protein